MGVFKNVNQAYFLSYFLLSLTRIQHPGDVSKRTLSGNLVGCVNTNKRAESDDEEETKCRERQRE